MLVGKKVEGPGDSGRWHIMESWKKDIDHRFGQFLDNSRAQGEAIEDLKSMFKSFMGNNKQPDVGSPSITQSALEIEESHERAQPAAPGLHPPSRKQVGGISAVMKDSGVPKAKRGSGKPSGKKHEDRVNAKLVDITNVD